MSGRQEERETRSGGKRGGRIRVSCPARARPSACSQRPRFSPLLTKALGRGATAGHSEKQASSRVQRSANRAVQLKQVSSPQGWGEMRESSEPRVLMVRCFGSRGRQTHSLVGWNRGGGCLPGMTLLLIALPQTSSKPTERLWGLLCPRASLPSPGRCRSKGGSPRAGGLHPWPPLLLQIISPPSGAALDSEGEAGVR